MHFGPTSHTAWEAAVLPLNYTRNFGNFNGGTVAALPINHSDGGDGTVGSVLIVLGLKPLAGRADFRN